MFALLLVVVAVVLAASAVSTAQASATTTADFEAQLSQLRADTMAAQSSFTKAKDFNNALAELDAAATKLAEGKIAARPRRSATTKACSRPSRTLPSPSSIHR